MYNKNNSIDTFQYVKNECNHDVLSKEEEIELAKRVDEGDEQARQELISKNKRLVVYLAKKFVNRGLEFSDLIGWGNIGLVKAVDRFDHTKGYKFSTYAKNWIESEIKLALKTQTKNIKVSDYMSRIIYRYINFINYYKEEHGKQPNSKVICEELDISRKKLALIVNNLQKEKSIYENLDKSDGANEMTLQEVLPSEKKDNKVSEKVVNDSFEEKMQEKLQEKLSEEDYLIFTSRYELFGNRFKTYKELGEIIGQSKENIRIRFQKIDKRIKAFGKRIKNN